jgi:formate hydrogenlyase subunit 3/multisubunit Na+/H+ antiporter MnhD subunit
LLIAFYRDRYLPVKNALKVFSIYRIADVGLLVAMWMSHHLWHENITFVTLFNQELVHEHIQTHSWIGVVISLMLLIAAAAKSAQLPFSSWLPRAMEGPTPSSAIFYGSLSVHIGVFLLLRTFPFWEHQTSVRILFGIVGLATAIVTTGIARVQSSVKSQIAYASIAQIGIIFIEVALGFDNLALIHFAGNAFLRTYQLLVSPSVVSYLIREQFYTFQKKKTSIESSWSKRLEYTYYMLCLKEWNLDSGLYRYFWNPLKSLGKKLNFLTVKRVTLFTIPLLVGGGFFLYHQEKLPMNILHWLPVIFTSIGLILVIKSFSERKDVYLSWMLVIINHFFIAIAVSFNEHYGLIENILYLSGIVVGGIIGYYALRTMQRIEGSVDLEQFHGHSYKHPKTAFVFLMCCLGMTGFPISPTFVGEDLVFSHIHEDQYALAAITSLGLIIDGLSAIRIYARVFLGPHAKSVYDMAYRNG